MVESLRHLRGLDRLEWCFLGVLLCILCVGVLSIYSVTPKQNVVGIPLFLKQTIWILAGALAFIVLGGIDYHKLARIGFILYGAGLILLVLVMVIGKSSRGAQRWIPLGPFAFQPSEFVKVPLLLTLATYYAAKTRRGWLQRAIIPALVALPGFVLILKQPDLGSSLGFLAIYVTLLLAVGVKSKAFGLILLSSLMLFPFAWGGLWGSLHDYQRERIMSFVNPTYDPGGKGYHGLQSRIAIGSGEIVGKGLYGGTQTQFKFLPEGHTDFVFAVFAEEWGFLGACMLLGLYLALFLLVLDFASKARDFLGALIAVGVVGMLSFGMVINIAMTAGLAPIVGIPLPLMSYGGSATVTTLAALGLVMSVKRRRLMILQ